MKSILTKKQHKTFGPVAFPSWDKRATIKAFVRFDDECNNGYNTFAITGEIRVPGRRDCEACGCLHDEIAKAFPDLSPFLKWHLCSTDGPMHYLANTLYFVEKGELDHARGSACWPDATDEELKSPDRALVLQARLPGLLDDFRAAVESLGFTW